MAMAAACFTASLPSSAFSKEASRPSPARHGAVAPSLAASPFLRPLRASPKLISAPVAKNRVTMSAGSSKGKDLGGPVALALIAAAVIPEIAEAASPGISPSLKNLLLSVVSGGVVLVAIGGAVAAVSLFDPVQRN